MPTDDESYRRYYQRPEPQWKVPQVGSVVIEDDVELGAGVMVDRGTIGPTVIRKGFKIDNLVQVAHNVEIGEHSILSGMTGLAGSVRIGRHVTVGGQVGMAEGVQVADGAVIAARSGLPPRRRVPAGAAFFGWEARPAEQALERHTSVSLLPRALERLKALEQEVAQLRAALAKEAPG